MVTGILHWCLYTCLDLIFDAIAYITFQAIDATCHAHTDIVPNSQKINKQKKTQNKQIELNMVSQSKIKLGLLSLL